MKRYVHSNALTSIRINATVHCIPYLHKRSRSEVTVTHSPSLTHRHSLTHSLTLTLSEFVRFTPLRSQFSVSFVFSFLYFLLSLFSCFRCFLHSFFRRCSARIRVLSSSVFLVFRSRLCALSAISAFLSFSQLFSAFSAFSFIKFSKFRNFEIFNFSTFANSQFSVFCSQFPIFQFSNFAIFICCSHSFIHPSIPKLFVLSTKVLYLSVFHYAIYQ